jgi:hypothetical protein
MTPQEQIAYLRARIDTFETVEGNAAILAVCDLAEKWLAHEAEEADAAADGWGGQDIAPDDHVMPR